MKSQHEAVIEASKKVLGDRFQPGVDIKSYITKEEKAAVATEVVKGFQEGQVSLSDEAKAKFADAKALMTYTVGMVTNWFNKSKELNGGEKYEAKNPGSRAGAQDEQVKEMKLLKTRLEAVGNTEGAAKVNAAIQARIAELKAETSSKKLPEVDLNKIPEHLRDLID